ncbi:hypothetical protein KGA66_06295 [Actinocrinis puniceicyclus]|uniref:Uncharacterized protein n=1 Tax=Actinocrinis puniceicyclus TaxID=977794 RepID=A0A8J8BB18_9ACTN|nr:hypothetical protein [Actinocrinis puniceicyclus]MBS2962648.1 hypothetical protein [Actinocrinis puniceicyclus]
MGSSGVIYAIIVGAWAVYLVPMWLRREDELNRARQTQRYAAAIKVLAHKDAFERRWARSDAAAEALPLAAGQGFVPTRRAVKRSASASAGAGVGVGVGVGQGVRVEAGAAEPWTPSPAKEKESGGGKAAKRTSVAAAGAPSASPGVGARATVAVNAEDATRATTRTAPPATAPKYPGPRTGLMARRRRVVGTLFMLSTLGALISADLGAGYLWAMAFPAVLLSIYIIRLRRDERIRAASRARRRAAAQQAREAREAREAESALQGAAAHERQGEREQDRARAMAQERVQAEADQRRRAQSDAVRRRSSAAGRSRAQAYVQEPPDLPRASNG